MPTDQEWDDEFDPRNLHHVREVILDALSSRLIPNSVGPLYANTYNWMCRYSAFVSNVQHLNCSMQTFELYNRTLYYQEHSDDVYPSTPAATDNGLQPVLPGFEPPQSSPRRYRVTLEILDYWED